MFLAYFDESGDSGIVNSPTEFFVLTCVLVSQENWLSTLDELIKLRQHLRDHHSIPTRPEIKATDIRKGRGPFTTLKISRQKRMELFKFLVEYQARKLVDTRCFSIAIDKRTEKGKKGDPRLRAWTYALQRVDRFCIAQDGKAILFPDEGNGSFVKKMVRRMRRHHQVPTYFGDGMISAPMERIIEDPNDRQSHDSYFIQLADWNAYACHRSRHVSPTNYVPDSLWDELGDRRLAEVNLLTGGPTGIVIYPRQEKEKAPAIYTTGA